MLVQQQVRGWACWYKQPHLSACRTRTDSSKSETFSNHRTALSANALWDWTRAYGREKSLQQVADNMPDDDEL